MRKLTTKDVFRAAFADLKDNTIQQYNYSYKVFSRYIYLEEKSISRPNIFKCFDWIFQLERGQVYLILKTYREYLSKNKKYKNRSINKDMYAINTLLTNAYDIGYIDWAPRRLKPLPIPDKELKDVQGPPPEIFLKIMTVAENEPGLWNKRDPAILAMMYYMGLRTTEVANIAYENLDMKARTVKYIGKRRSSETTQSIPEPCIPYLEKYLKFRDKRKSPLFRSIDTRSKRFVSHGIKEGAIYEMVVRLSKKAGHKINPHALRHSNVNLVTSALARAGLGIDYLQSWTRHKDIKELTFYMDKPFMKQEKVSTMITKDMGLGKNETIQTDSDKLSLILKELEELKAKIGS